MTSPHYRPPDKPGKPPTGSKKERVAGGIAATSVVVLIGVIVGVTNPVPGGPNAGIMVSPASAIGGVVLGSILVIFERTRQFALGFLITSALLIFVTGGACVVAAFASL